jgi:NAD dependent epimerase/dehydratase family enzyme
MLNNEFQYYLDHQQELVKKYKGKYLVIIGEEVVGVYNSDKEALFESQKKYELGSFLIQLCEPGDKSYTQVFHSRVVFA